MAGVSEEKLKKALEAILEIAQYEGDDQGRLEGVNSLNQWLKERGFIASGSEARLVGAELRNRGLVETTRVKGGRGLYANYLTPKGFKVAMKKVAKKKDELKHEEPSDELEGMSFVVEDVVRTAKEQAEQIRDLRAQLESTIAQLAAAQAENDRLHDFIDELIQAAGEAKSTIHDALQG